MVRETSVSLLEGVDARAPSSLQFEHRVGGVPLCGLPLAVFSVPCSGGVVCLALSRVGRFTPARLARMTRICHATWFTRDPCHSLGCRRAPLKVPTCIALFGFVSSGSISSFNPSSFVLALSALVLGFGLSVVV